MPVPHRAGVVIRRSVPLGIGHFDQSVVMLDEGLADRCAEGGKIPLGRALVGDQEQIHLVEGGNGLSGQVVEVAGTDADHQGADPHRATPTNNSRSALSSIASASLSIIASRRPAKVGASVWGRHGEPLAAAISANQARRKPSFSSVPCHIVPQTWPTRQPSRNAFASPVSWATPW